MGQWKGLRLDWLQKGIHKLMELTIFETFALVEKMNTVRVLLSLATRNNWSLHQMDMKNAFLNGELNEEMYMHLPLGFEENPGKGKVCKLLKSLYGLKQSPRA